MQPMPDTLRALLTLSDEWGLPTERARKEKRGTATMAEIEGFYARVRPLLPDIIAFLETCSYSDPDPDHVKLGYLVFMHLECMMSVEFYNQPELPNGFPRQRFHVSEM